MKGDFFMRKLRKAIPLALAMSVALTMTPIRTSAEEPTQVQAEQSDLVEENESLSDEADKDKEEPLRGSVKAC